jgi:hypothetical protein
MWLASIVAAIALLGTAFMIRFLVALLCEAAPSKSGQVIARSRYIVPETRTERRGNLAVTFAAERKSDEYIDLSENHFDAKECVSGLMALTLRHVPAGSGWRSIRAGRASALQQHRF